MKQEVDIEVEIIRTETIKASLLPCSPPKTFTLSLLDQIFPATHVPVLLYYRTSPPSRVDIPGLKTSLSLTLDHFYHFAGRFQDDSNISCNNQGIFFIETKINSNLSLVINSPNKLNFLTKFLPDSKLLGSRPKPISEVVPLAFQINVFLCGGVVIGCYMLHKLLDAASLATFLKYWSALSRKRFNDLIQPDFESTIKAFPPIPSEEYKGFLPNPSKANSSMENSPSKIVVKSFIFNSHALANLKAKAASEFIPNPSRVQALAAFIWEQMLATQYNPTYAKIKNTILALAVNIRPRMSKPLPKESIGNLITYVYPQCDATATPTKLQDLVKEIHLALSEIKVEIQGQYEGENRTEVLCQMRRFAYQSVVDCQEGLYKLTSWCNFGLSEADFGFGKPVWIIPIDAKELSPKNRNFIYFTDCSDGIEVWLYLEENEMLALESNPHFLAFCKQNTGM